MTAQPQTHSLAPMENKLAALANGQEVYFFDSQVDEAMTMLETIAPGLNHIVKRNNPHEGFTRICIGWKAGEVRYV